MPVFCCESRPGFLVAIPPNVDGPVHRINFGSTQLSPVQLLNTPAVYKLDGLFPNVCVSLHILLAMPAIVAFAECSYSKLKLIKNSEIRSPRRLVNAGIDTEIAKSIEFDSGIQYKTLSRKSQKGPFA